LALEGADEVTDLTKDASLFLPLADDLGLERVAARIEAGPKFFNRSRDGLRGLAGNEGGGREGA
jgi:hypothetical protein